VLKDTLIMTRNLAEQTF